MSGAQNGPTSPNPSFFGVCVFLVFVFNFVFAFALFLFVLECFGVVFVVGGVFVCLFLCVIVCFVCLC